MQRAAEPLAGGVAERSWVLDAVASLGEALLVVDEQGHIVYYNAAAEAIGGFNGLSWPEGYDLFYHDECTRVPTAELPIRRALEGVEVRNVSLFVRNASYPDGVHLMVSASPIRDRQGNIRGAASLWRDVTLVRRQECQLREGARQMQAILDNIPDMAWLKDEHGSYLHVNQPVADATGRESSSDLVGLTDRDLWPPEIAERYRAGDMEVMQGASHLRLEEPFIDASGAKRWIETIKTRIVDDAGTVIGTTGIARDITERRQAEDHMRTTKDELERRVHERTAELAEAQENLVRQERLAILGQLAGGVAHQIRNPLAAIMNSTYVLRRHLSPEQHPNVGDAIRIIHDEVRHANIIITGLLDYARVRTPDRHPASLVDLLERILDSDWIPHTVKITKDLPHGDPVVYDVDADQLGGAISNLIRNAVEAMPDGGELQVALSVRARPDDPDIVITVSDNGPGISAQVRAHLFEPLHSTKPMGIGLGLVTARRFVEAHGGRIASVDAPRGARFEIRLPPKSG